MLGALSTAFALSALLARPGGAERTFRADIAPFLKAKCVGCHREGGSGPFSLKSYDDVRKRADLIRSVVLLQKMPPTLAESDFGPLVRYPKLAPTEIVALQEWLRTGMKEGSGAAPKAEPEPEWPLGPPSRVIHVQSKVGVPSEGPMYVNQFPAALPLEATTDLVAFDIRPNCPQAMRQAILAANRPGSGTGFTPTGAQADLVVGAWALGAQPWKLPDSAGFRLNPGDHLQIRALYHPTGKVEDSGFQLALYFDEKIRPNRPYWKTLGSNEFELPGTPPAFTELTATLRLGEAARVVSLMPEARRLCTGVRVGAKQGADWNRILLLLWRWDRRWASAYNFADAPLLTAGSEIVAKFQYDNSTHGTPGLTLDQIKRLPNNPSVRFGPNETDELFWVHVQLVAYP